MSTWLTAIVINAARMTLRQGLPQVRISLDGTYGEENHLLAETLPDHQPNPEEVCCSRELGEGIAGPATQLSPTLRKTFQLQDLDGLSVRETAHLLGVQSGTVKAQLARGRLRLKEIMRKSLRGNDDAARSVPATEAQLRAPIERETGSYEDWSIHGGQIWHGTEFAFETFFIPRHPSAWMHQF